MEWDQGTLTELHSQRYREHQQNTSTDTGRRQGTLAQHSADCTINKTKKKNNPQKHFDVAYIF